MKNGYEYSINFKGPGGSEQVRLKVRSDMSLLGMFQKNLDPRYNTERDIKRSFSLLFAQALRFLLFQVIYFCSELIPGKVESPLLGQASANQINNK